MYLYLKLYEQAAGHLKRAIALTPGYAPDLNFNLAVSLHEIRDYPGSVRECQGLLGYHPQHVQGLLLLAVNLQRLGDVNEAIKHCELASTLDRNNPEPYLQLGRLYSATNSMRKSEESFMKALQLDHDNVRAMSGLALVHRSRQDIDSAVTLLRKAIDIDPEHAHAYNDLGIIYRESGKYSEAERCYRTAVDLDESLIEAWINLGFLYTATSEYEKSLDSFQKALAIDSSNVDAAAGETGVLFRKGSVSEAYDKISLLIKTGSVNPQLATIYADVSSAFDCEDDAIRLLQNALDEDGLAVSQQIDLHYAFGKLLDSAGEYDESFRHYEIANELRPASFDQDKFEQSIDLLISVFSKEPPGVALRPNMSHEQPIFIVGMPRSGTSLVEQIISSHSSVYGAGELNSIHMLAERLGKTSEEGGGYPGCIFNLGEKELNDAADEYLGALRGLAPNALRVTDKMPGNFIHLGLINRLFPQARVIHCIRDPLDTCLSCYFQHFSTGHDYSYYLQSLGFYYRQYKRLMNHWSSVLTMPVMDVQYESLVQSPEEYCRAIIEFCGLEWEDECLEFYRNKRVVTTASYDQVRRPIYSSSIGRWKKYDNFLGSLRQALSLDSTGENK